MSDATRIQQPAPADAGERRLLARVGAEAWRGLSRQTRRTLLDGSWPGEPDARGLQAGVVGELRGMGLAPEQIAGVYAVSAFGAPPDELDDLIREADARIAADRQAAEVARRGGQNFTVTHVRRVEEAHRALWLFVVRRLDTGAEHAVRLRAADLHDEWAFERACLEQINLLPVLREHDRGDRFRAWAAYLVGTSGQDEPARATTARVDGQAEALIVALVRELVDRHDGAWQSTAGTLWKTLSARATERGMLPLGWPKSPATLTWALMRADGALGGAGIEWARGRTPDKRRDSTISFRLDDAERVDRGARWSRRGR